MTVSSSAERNDYTGDGSTATYAYSYRITDDDHLLVTVADEDGAETTLTKTTDYTVTGVGVKTGGDIVLVDDSQDWIDDDGYLADGWALTVRHYVPLAQDYDIRNLGAYYPETHEDAFDYLMWAVKQQQDEIDRCIKMGETVSSVTIVFPSPEDGKAIVWDGTAGAMKNEDFTGPTGPTGPQGPAGADGADGIFTAIASQEEAEAGTENTKGMTALRTAQAIAALGSSKFGEYEEKAFNTVYQAVTDGFVSGYTDSIASKSYSMLTDSSNPPTTHISLVSLGSTMSVVVPLSISVKKGNYWKVLTDAAGGKVFWMPAS